MFNLFRVLEMSYLEELLPEFRKGAKIRISTWPKNQYIYLSDYDIFGEDNKLVTLSGNQIHSHRWELYQDPEPDWNYIIKNKCLCWFWDNKGDEKQIGYLVGINDKRFYLEAPEDCFNSYTYCRPVRKNEVTFYEDKE